MSRWEFLLALTNGDASRWVVMGVIMLISTSVIAYGQILRVRKMQKDKRFSL